MPNFTFLSTPPTKTDVLTESKMQKRIRVSGQIVSVILALAVLGGFNKLSALSLLLALLSLLVGIFIFGKIPLYLIVKQKKDQDKKTLLVNKLTWGMMIITWLISVYFLLGITIIAFERGDSLIKYIYYLVLVLSGLAIIKTIHSALTIKRWQFAKPAIYAASALVLYFLIAKTVPPLSRNEIKNKGNVHRATIPTLTATLAPTATPSLRPPSPSPVSPTPVPVQKTYVSNRFGIKFKYLNLSIYGTPVAVDELGNTIYVHDDSPGASFSALSQHVIVFHKNSGVSFQQAIKDQLFYRKNDFKYCKIVVSKDKRYPDSYRKAIVTSVSEPFSPEFFKKRRNAKDFNGCPGTSIGVKQFFLYDTNHPDKMLFFSLSLEYFDILSGNKGKLEKYWYDTVRFVD